MKPATLPSNTSVAHLTPSDPRREAMEGEDWRNLRTLEAIAEDAEMTQRTLAGRLGMALGLANLCLKRLVRKGWVKCVNLRSNRLRYLLTPAGIAEKTRLTYEFMEYSLFLYGQLRQHLREQLCSAVRENRKRIAVYGTGDVAELAFLSMAELDLELVAVFGAGGGHFLGHVVRPIEKHEQIAFDLLLVAVLDRSEQQVAGIVASGIARERLVVLRPHE